jgi:hypothetical protein
MTKQKGMLILPSGASVRVRFDIEYFEDPAGNQNGGGEFSYVGMSAHRMLLDITSRSTVVLDAAGMRATISVTHVTDQSGVFRLTGTPSFSNR